MTYQDRFHLLKGNGLAQDVFKPKNVTFRRITRHRARTLRRPEVFDPEEAQPFL